MGLEMDITTPNGDRIEWGKRASMIHWWLSEKQRETKGERISECGEYELPASDLTELAHVCQQVLDDHAKAEELLPGAYGYDGVYFDEVRRTRDFIESAAATHGPDAWFDYWVSW